MKDTSRKRHPLYRDEPTLDFGQDFVLDEMTEDQKADAFLSKYMDLVDPVGKYEKYFSSSAKNLDHILKEVKIYYKKLVVSGDWTEKKYVAVLDDIFTNRAVLSVMTLDSAGLRHDRGLLASQREVRRKRK